MQSVPLRADYYSRRVAPCGYQTRSLPVSRQPPAHTFSADLAAGYEMELALHEGTLERICTWQAMQTLLGKMNDARTVDHWVRLSRDLDIMCTGEILPCRGSEYES